MRALTLYRPWPWAILHAQHNPKLIENRSWKPPPSIIGQRIILHAGATFQKDAVDDILHLTKTSVLPAEATDMGLIGMVTVRGYASSEAECEQFMLGLSDWFSGPFGWLLSDRVVFKEPIAIKGAMGLWEVPRWAMAKVEDQLR